MRVIASMLACLFALAPLPGAGAPVQPSREDALVALCRLWNAVRFTYPSLASESDASWDDALVAAEPMLERDPGALHAAAAAMLGALLDPVTTVDVDRAGPPAKMPTAGDQGGVRVVHLNGLPDAATADAYAKALVAALAVPASDRALVVDLRAGGLPSIEQIGYAEDVWSRTPLAARVVTAPVTTPLLGDRYFLGFPSESGTTTGDYREGRSTASPRVIAPASDARAIPVAFVVDANAVVTDEAVALQRAGRAAIFSSDGSPGILPGDATPFDAGAGLSAVLRTSAPLDVTPVTRGDLDTALAWVRDPKPVAMAGVAPSVPVGADKRFAGKALPDEAHRVLAAFRIWGTIEYLFPYKDLMRDDWDAALHAGLADLHGVTTPLDYELALVKMYAHIHDTHGFVAAPAIRAAYAAVPAFVARDVEGRPTIVRVDPVAAKRDGFAVGDVIEAVDGEPAAVRAARLRPYVGASTEQSARAIFDDGLGSVSLLAGPAGSTVALRLRAADNRVRDVHTPRVAYQPALRVRTRPAVEVLPGNVGYVDLQRLEQAGVDAMFQRLAATRAIVFDLRGYPRSTFYLLAPHFAPATVSAALFRTPVSHIAHGVEPSNAGVRFHAETRDFEQLIKPAAPRYGKPVVVVIDSRAISQSEHTALFLEASAHARFVGEPTTGANGDVTSFFVPGGVQLNFSGQAVLHPDGTQLQRVGIVPGVRVAATLRGVRSGDDELLAAGVREALRLGGADAKTTITALAAERKSERADAKAQGTPAATSVP